MKRLTGATSLMLNISDVEYQGGRGEAISHADALAQLADLQFPGTQAETLAAWEAARDVLRQASEGDVVVLEDAQHEALAAMLERQYRPEALMLHRANAGSLNRLTLWLRSATTCKAAAAEEPGGGLPAETSAQTG